MSHVEIKFATQNDAKLLSEMGARAFLSAFADQNDPDEIASYVKHNFAFDQIHTEVKDPDSTFLLAYREHQPLAYAKLKQGQSPEVVNVSNPIELERIYVEPTSIGGGIGSELLLACIREAKSRGFEGIWLGVWEKNPQAIRFYERNHFKKVGEHTFMLGSEAQTDILMQRPINPSAPPERNNLR
ncbi:MAG: GNAT family N-acetyltransferase [Chloroflexi bacterium]|nr:GNAT family N-acetyltransferase [Chloroflexota bacterium]MQC26154.1 GNAT family N-acetyltransferase [Chloroflexota bacterium]